MTAVTNVDLQYPRWKTVVIFTLAFWLSSSLFLDVVIMPSMYAAGMMEQPGFATAGYSLFWLFNRIELLCSALVLTGILVLQRTVHRTLWVEMAIALLATTLICTYGLTPEMSALGLQLDLFSTSETIPAQMNQMHGAYWLIEGFKFFAGGVLLWFAYKLKD